MNVHVYMCMHVCACTRLVEPLSLPMCVRNKRRTELGLWTERDKKNKKNNKFTMILLGSIARFTAAAASSPAITATWTSYLWPLCSANLSAKGVPSSVSSGLGAPYQACSWGAGQGPRAGRAAWLLCLSSRPICLPLPCPALPRRRERWGDMEEINH